MSDKHVDWRLVGECFAVGAFIAIALISILLWRQPETKTTGLSTQVEVPNVDH